MSQVVVQASQSVPQDSMVTQNTMDDGLPKTTLSEPSESALVEKQGDGDEYLDIWSSLLSAPQAGVGTITSSHKSDEKIVIDSSNDTSFDDSTSHPSTKDDLMDVDSGRVGQTDDQQIPPITQLEQTTILPQADVRVTISETSTHETLSHEQIHFNSVASHLPNFSNEAEFEDYSVTQFLLEADVLEADKPTIGSPQAATSSLTDVVGQLTELSSMVTSECSKLSTGLESVQKDKELTVGTLEKLTNAFEEHKASVTQELMQIQLNQNKVTEALDGLTKAISEMSSSHQAALSQLEKSVEDAHDKFTTKVSNELRDSTKAKVHLKEELIGASKGLIAKVNAMDDDILRIHGDNCVANFRLSTISTTLHKLSQKLIDDDKKGEKEREAEESKRRKKESEFVAREVAKLKKIIDERNKGIPISVCRDLVVFSNQAEPSVEEVFEKESTIEGEDKVEMEVDDRLNEEKIDEEVVVTEKENVGEIRVEKSVDESDIPQTQAVQTNNPQSDPVQSVADPNPNVVESSSSDDNVAIGYLIKKRTVQNQSEGPSETKPLTEEEEQLELAKREAEIMHMSLEDVLKLQQQDRREVLAEIAARDEEMLRKEEEDLEKAESVKKGKKGRKVVVQSTPSLKRKEVASGIAHKSGLDKVDRSIYVKKLNFRRHETPITACHLQKSRGQDLPFLKLTRGDLIGESVKFKEIGDLGYTEWVEIYNVIKSSNKKYLRMVMEELQRRFDKIKNLGIDVSGLPQPEGIELIIEETQPLRKKQRMETPASEKNADVDKDAYYKNLDAEAWKQILSPELIARSLSKLNLKLPEGMPEDSNGLFTETPEHGLCFMTRAGMLFQRTSELHLAPSMHLFTLYGVCQRHKDVSEGFEKFLWEEANKRHLDISQLPTYEVKKEVVEME